MSKDKFSKKFINVVFVEGTNDVEFYKTYFKNCRISTQKSAFKSGMCLKYPCRKRDVILNVEENSTCIGIVDKDYDEDYLNLKTKDINVYLTDTSDLETLLMFYSISHFGIENCVIQKLIKFSLCFNIIADIIRTYSDGNEYIMNLLDFVSIDQTYDFYNITIDIFLKLLIKNINFLNLSPGKKNGIVKKIEKININQFNVDENLENINLFCKFHGHHFCGLSKLYNVNCIISNVQDMIKYFLENEKDSFRKSILYSSISSKHREFLL